LSKCQDGRINSDETSSFLLVVFDGRKRKLDKLLGRNSSADEVSKVVVSKNEESEFGAELWNHRTKFAGSNTAFWVSRGRQSEIHERPAKELNSYWSLIVSLEVVPFTRFLLGLLDSTNRSWVRRFQLTEQELRENGTRD